MNQLASLGIQICKLIILDRDLDDTFEQLVDVHASRGCQTLLWGGKPCARRLPFWAMARLMRPVRQQPPNQIYMQLSINIYDTK